MISGARQGKMNGLRRLIAKAMAKDLTVFVVPGLDVARVHGLDIEAAGLQVVASPRHASVLLILGDMLPAMRDAASIVYAQMMRPKAVFALGVENKEALAPLPAANVSVGLSQSGLIEGVSQLRTAFEKGAFQMEVTDYDAPTLQVRIEYVCPMHPDVVRDEPGSCPKCGMFLVPREAQADATQAHAAHKKRDDNTDAAIRSARKHTGHEQMIHSPTADAGEKPEQSAQHETMLEYVCPMHPEVVQDGPGDCPKCGMHLEPREKAAGEKHEHQHMHQGSSAEKDGHHHAPQEFSREYVCPMHPEVVQDEPGDCPKCGMHLEPREKAAGEKHSSSTHEHGNMNTEDHSQMNHDESGFMSMVEVTRDLPRSSDGLQMEWIDVPFGPFFPGLPSGLQLAFSLDGDTVAGSQIHSISENTRLLEYSPMHAGCFVKHFLSLDPLTPVSSQLLVCQAMEDAAGIAVDAYTAKARIGALERERIVSHLNWLVLFAQQTGFVWLMRSAGLLQLKFLSANLKQIDALRPEIQKLIKHIQKTPLLKPRTSGIGQLRKNNELRGVVARATDVDNDMRSHDNIYISLGFKAIRRREGDAWARMQVRLDEIKQSLELIDAAGAIALPEMINLDEVSGIGKSQIETPRGKTVLELSMDKGFVTSVQLDTPSMHHLGLIETLTGQQELGDALVAVGSLDLSPWEMRQ